MNWNEKTLKLLARYRAKGNTYTDLCAGTGLGYHWVVKYSNQRGGSGWRIDYVQTLHDYLVDYFRR